MKLYQFFVLARLSWPFLVHDFNHSFAQAWAGLYRSVDLGVLFRSKEQFGLGLTSVADHFERMQIIRCQLLKDSIDPEVRSIYNAKVRRELLHGRVWRATQLASIVESEAQHRIQFP